MQNCTQRKTTISSTDKGLKGIVVNQALSSLQMDGHLKLHLKERTI